MKMERSGISKAHPTTDHWTFPVTNSCVKGHMLLENNRLLKRLSAARPNAGMLTLVFVSRSRRLKKVLINHKIYPKLTEYDAQPGSD